MTVRTYRDLEAWQRAMNMVEQFYKATKNFPRDLPGTSAKALDEVSGSVGRLLNGLLRGLRSKQPRT
jgi:hypothetical protein